MRTSKLLDKIKTRQQELGIKIENISILSQVKEKTIQSFFDGKDIKETELIKITTLLGLDIFGNEVISIQELKKQRAKEKALYIVSLVQDTSSLENQGVDEKHIELLLEDVKEQFLTGEYQNNLWEI